MSGLTKAQLQEQLDELRATFAELEAEPRTFEVPEGFKLVEHSIINATNTQLARLRSEVAATRKDNETLVKNAGQLRRALARKDATLTEMYETRGRLTYRLSVARRALTEIVDAGWPRVSKRLVTIAADALEELRRTEGGDTRVGA